MFWEAGGRVRRDGKLVGVAATEGMAGGDGIKVFLNLSCFK